MFLYKIPAYYTFFYSYTKALSKTKNENKSHACFSKKINKREGNFLLTFKNLIGIIFIFYFFNF